SQEPFSSTGTEVRAWGAGVSLMHQLLIMPSGPRRIDGGSSVPGGGSGIFDPTIQYSHVPGLIESSAPAAHAHTWAMRMRTAVSRTAAAARISYLFLCVARCVHQPTKPVQARVRTSDRCGASLCENTSIQPARRKSFLISSV